MFRLKTSLAFSSVFVCLFTLDLKAQHVSSSMCFCIILPEKKGKNKRKSNFYRQSRKLIFTTKLNIKSFQLPKGSKNVLLLLEK